VEGCAWVFGWWIGEFFSFSWISIQCEVFGREREVDGEYKTRDGSQLVSVPRTWTIMIVSWCGEVLSAVCVESALMVKGWGVCELAAES